MRIYRPSPISELGGKDLARLARSGSGKWTPHFFSIDRRSIPTTGVRAEKVVPPVTAV